MPSSGIAQERNRIRDALPQLLSNWQRLLADPESILPLLYARGTSRVVLMSPKDYCVADDWFFIGDIHGDFYALSTLLQFAERERPSCRIAFLGDVVDRADCPLECLFLLLDWALAHPGRLLWIAGNHDLAFFLDDESGRFNSRVRPADFLDVLNFDDALTGVRRQLGQFFIDLAARLPRAVLFPDGLLVTHGGFPLRDLHEDGLQAPTAEAFLSWLNSDRCLKDFTWTRAHRAPKKIPNRYSSDPQYGYIDFEAFCGLRPDWFPARRMITGHVHPTAGYEIHASYETNPAMTLIGFGFDDAYAPPASFWHYRDHLHIAHHRDDSLPAIIPIPVDKAALSELYPPPPTEVPEPLPEGDSDASP